MKTTSIRFAALAVVAGVIATSFGAHASVAQDATGGIRDTKWQLVAIGDVPFAPGAHVGTVAFNLGPNNVLTGTTGCNMIKSGYSLDGNDLSFSMPLTTKKYCASARPTEQAFLGVLHDARGYEVVGDTLVLTGANGEMLAKFVPGR